MRMIVPNLDRKPTSVRALQPKQLIFLCCVNYNMALMQNRTVKMKDLGILEAKSLRSFQEVKQTDMFVWGNNRGGG